MPNTIPRRWSIEVDGIRWLPRMIDKARMRQSGTLGAYLMGHSPVDRALLKRLTMTTDQFVALVNAQHTDVDVLNALRAGSMDETAVRKWSDDFPRRYKKLISLWDLDEGYRRANFFERFAASAFRLIERPVMDAYRRSKPAP